MDQDWFKDICTKRKSLRYSDDNTKVFSFMNQSKQIDSSARDRVKLTQVFKSGHRLGSVFLDITDRKETLANICQLIAQQYPSRNGVLIRRDKNMTFLEINFDVKDLNLNAILNQGITFDDQSVVIPCIALSTKFEAVYVRLYNLPLCNKDELYGMLKSSLGTYGNVLDVGMLLEPSTDTYMGTGYAIINTKFNAKKPLSHKIKGPNNKYEFYAMWNSMPDFCHCCHADDHAFDTCSERVTGEIYPEPVFENKRDAKEEEAYNSYILFILKMERRIVIIGVVSNDFPTILYIIKRGTQLRRVMKAHCERMGRSRKSTRFLYDGRLVLNHQTPDDLEMEDEDTIDIQMEQIG